MKTHLELRTERLLLRPIKASDAAEIFTYRSDAETNKYQGWIPETIEDVGSFVAKVSTEINISDTWFQFVIIDIKTSTIIGDVGIHFIDAAQAEIGCTLAKNQHGKGYASEALKAVIDYLFHTLNKHRIIASIDPLNMSSISLVERLNFRKEAHFKESLFINGEWVDDIVYAILKKEW
ncbi:GNAT family N-acetyltransferase [Saccharicrinis aurantiacus]|uniref:GNAT family N-acetyltransferase n=1 Tax=Saccharicrinis aurantiacus TaxID=1849719 RepID=UPI00094FCBEF|nr:GNAT family protein [Saccharicrinis aurantiacus]